MRNYLLSMAFLGLNLLALNAQAQAMPEMLVDNFVDVSAVAGPKADNQEIVGRNLSIYGLIVSIYALYWFKHKV